MAVGGQLGIILLTGCAVDLSRNRVVRDGGAEDRLTSREGELLSYLATRAGQTVARTELLTEVWGYSPKAMTRAVDSTVQRLRTKIEPECRNPVHILTVQGVGYRFEATTVHEARRPAPTVIHVTPTAFFGRTALLQELARLRGAGRQLITLVGPPGTGKTRLAMEFARRQHPPGGAHLCDLSATRSVDDLLHSVARTLAVPLAPDADVAAGIEQIGEALASRPPCLLVLDNFEQVTDHAPATVSRWLRMAPDTTAIVTSRERLAVPGEYVCEVVPLADADAVQLFTDRARLARPGWSADGEDSGLALELVRRLDGLPLAIELAAARVAVLTVRQILDRLDQRFRLLRGRRVPDARQATLYGAIAWSWDLLCPWERAALVQCAVFRGGFTVEAAEAVIDLSPWPNAPSILEVVQSLREKSLLRTVPHGDAAQLRLSLYESIREFATEKLSEPIAVEVAATPVTGPLAQAAARHRHAAWYASLGEDEAIDRLVGPDAVPLTRALLAERANLFDAVRWAIAAGNGGVAAQGLAAVIEILVLHGPAEEGRELAEAVLAFPLPPLVRANALLAWARAWHRSTLDTRPSEGVTEALDIARREGSPAIEARALRALAGLQGRRSQPSETRELLEQALRIGRETNNMGTTAGAYGSLGNWHGQRGDELQAEACYRHALVFAREMGNRRFEGLLLANVAQCRRRQGRIASAWSHYEQAHDIAVELGDRITEGMIRECYANLAREQGRLAEARGHYQAALEIATQAGMPAARLLGNMALLFQTMGQVDQARRHHEQSIAALRRQGVVRDIAIGLGNYGELLLALDERGEARLRLEEALALLGPVRDPVSLGAFLGPYATLQALEGDLEGARKSLARAEAALEPDDHPLERAKLVVRQGEVAHLAGDRAQAQAHLARAHDLAERIRAGQDSEVGAMMRRLQARIDP